MRRILIILALIISIFVILFILVKNFQENSYRDYKFTKSKVTKSPKQIKIDANLRNNLPEFNLSSKNKMLESFGINSKETIQKHPEILTALKKMDSSINNNSLDAGSENTVAILPDGKTYVLLNGCIEDKKDFKCDGSVRVVVLDPEKEKIYMLAENGAGRYAADPKVYIYGNPPEDIMNLLLYSYFY